DGRLRLVVAVLGEERERGVERRERSVVGRGLRGRTRNRRHGRRRRASLGGGRGARLDVGLGNTARAPDEEPGGRDRRERESRDEPSESRPRSTRGLRRRRRQGGSGGRLRERTKPGRRRFDV